MDTLENCRYLESLFGFLKGLNVHPTELLELSVSVFHALKPEVWPMKERDQNLKLLTGEGWKTQKQSAFKHPVGRYPMEDGMRGGREKGKNATDIKFNFLDNDEELKYITMEQVINNFKIKLEAGKLYKCWNKGLKKFAGILARSYDLKAALKPRTVVKVGKAQREYALSTVCPSMNIGMNYPVAIQSYVRPGNLGVLKLLIDCFEFKETNRQMGVFPKTMMSKVSSLRSKVPEVVNSYIMNGRPTEGYKFLKQLCTAKVMACGSSQVIPQELTIHAAVSAYTSDKKTVAQVLESPGMSTCDTYKPEELSVLATEAMMGQLWCDNGIRTFVTGKRVDIDDNHYLDRYVNAKVTKVTPECWRGPVLVGRTGSKMKVGANMGFKGIHASPDVAREGYAALKRLRTGDFEVDNSAKELAEVDRVAKEGFTGTTITGAEKLYKMEYHYFRSAVTGRKRGKGDNATVPKPIDRLFEPPAAKKQRYSTRGKGRGESSGEGSGPNLMDFST